MRPRSWLDLGDPRAARAATAAVVAYLGASALWAAFGAGGVRGEYAADCAALGIDPPASPTERQGAARAASPAAPHLTLWADLFPQQTPEPPPPPPPALELDLIAVIDSARGRSAFLYDRASKKYLELGEGDRSPGAAVALVTYIGPRHAEFDLAGRVVRLELAP